METLTNERVMALRRVADRNRATMERRREEYASAAISGALDARTFVQAHLEGWPISDEMVADARVRVDLVDEAQARYARMSSIWWESFKAAGEAEEGRLAT